MEDKQFLHACNLINKSLVDLKMDRTFNSIGSNVFFEFGKEKEIVFKNGKKHLKKEWAIWISLSSWRITKSNKYIVGSGDSPQIIQLNIQKLLGKRFQSFHFFSQFLDAEFNFEEDYQVTTFFNWLGEDQWTVFLPDETSIGIDCSNEEAIENIQSIAKHFPIVETYKNLDFPLKDVVLTKITYNKHNLPIFHFENDSSLHLEACAWRLEKNNNYVVGCLDNDHERIKEELFNLIGKKLKEIDVANLMMDARLQFENGYVLKTFTCCRIADQWKIYVQKKPVFFARILILDQD